MMPSPASDELEWAASWLTCPGCGYEVMTVWWLGSSQLQCSECHEWFDAPYEEDL